MVSLKVPLMDIVIKMATQEVLTVDMEMVMDMELKSQEQSTDMVVPGKSTYTVELP